MTDDFDRLIETGLSQALSSTGSPPPGLEPRYLHARMRSRNPMSLLTAIPTRAAIAVAAASLATGGGLAAKTVATGTPHPLVWGQKVETQVETCKAQLSAGQHGIGDCVSDFASRKGQEERAAHAAGKGEGKGDADHPTPNAEASHGKGAPAGAGKPSDTPGTPSPHAHP